MDRSHVVWRFAVGLVAGAAVALSFAPSWGAEPPTASERALYHADPDHLWNRLHEALFVRVGPDGRTYGRDRLEPLLWYGSRHLLEEASNRRAVAMLQEFLKNNGETLIDDPLKRAVIQRDLWLVFDWLEGDHGHFYEPELKPEEVRAARDRLRRPLAAVIGRLALTPDQIRKLPDNYAAAVASGDFPRHFDSERPDRPFLPADLFAADGPWVCVGRPDGPVAPEHLGGANLYTNSAFLVLLKLPAGRAATLDYLERLRSFDQPLRVEATGAGNPAEKYLPNPKLPPLPAATEVALVRRALLIDSSNVPTATALTESVQLRVYRDVPEMTGPAVRAALGASSNGTAPGARRVQAWQSFHEFHLSRERLFAGRAGGLRATGLDERDFRTPFFLWILDEFENPEYRDPRRPDQPFAERSQTVIKSDCLQCHSLPGVASFNSYFNFRANLRNTTAPRPFSLAEMPASEVAAEAVKWNRGRSKWAVLRTLLATD